MKVCHIGSAHRIGDTGILYKQCKSLSCAGYDVSHAVSSSAFKDDGVFIVGIGDCHGGRSYRICFARRAYKTVLDIDADIATLHVLQSLSDVIRFKKMCISVYALRNVGQNNDRKKIANKNFEYLEADPPAIFPDILCARAAMGDFPSEHFFAPENSKKAVGAIKILFDNRILVKEADETGRRVSLDKLSWATGTPLLSCIKNQETAYSK